MHPLLRSKLTLRFTLFDADRDGYVDANDFTEQARRMLMAAGIAADAPQAHRLHEEYERGWDRLCRQVGRDRDARLAVEEFIDAWNAVVEAEGFDQVMLPIIDNIMELMDTDGDDKLGQQEFTRWLTAYQVDEPDAVEAFRRLDRDGTGRIDRTELTAAFVEFYTGTDPDAPGAWLYGPLDAPSASRA
jgi:Ca2+-binding EF-hand superfamily protein